MTAEEINKGVNISDGESNFQKEKVTLNIVKSEAVQSDPSHEHPLINSTKNGVFLCVKAQITDGSEDFKGQYVEFVGNLLTKKGDIACYPGNDEIKPALLWEIKEAIKIYDKSQLKEDWMKNWSPRDFEGLRMKFEVKYVKSAGGNEFYIPMTAYQKKKDELYNKQAKGDSNSNDEVDIDPDDLPFS